MNDEVLPLVTYDIPSCMYVYACRHTHNKTAWKKRGGLLNAASSVVVGVLEISAGIDLGSG